MTLAVRKAVSEYYEGWLECENPICGKQTQILPLGFDSTYPTCRKCKDGELHRVVSWKNIYIHTSHFKNILNILKFIII